MSDFSYFAIFGRAEDDQDQPTELRVATVGDYSESLGSTLIFAGAEATQKRYKRLSGASISTGSLVLVGKVSGTYVILGAIV